MVSPELRVQLAATTLARVRALIVVLRSAVRPPAVRAFQQLLRHSHLLHMSTCPCTMAILSIAAKCGKAFPLASACQNALAPRIGHRGAVPTPLRLTRTYGSPGSGARTAPNLMGPHMAICAPSQSYVPRKRSQGLSPVAGESSPVRTGAGARRLTADCGMSAVRYGSAPQGALAGHLPTPSSLAKRSGR